MANDGGCVALAGSLASLEVTMHPVALYTMADAHTRRAEGLERVVGTLLGHRKGGEVEVKDAYAVPHTESNGQIALDIEFHRTMLDLHNRVNTRETVVGWFSTSKGIETTDALVHEFYSKEANDPVHVSLDPTLSDPRSSLLAYVGAPLRVPGTKDSNPIATHFRPIGVRFNAEDPEMQRTPALSSEGAEEPVNRLLALVRKALGYVDGVLAGENAPDARIGRHLDRAMVNAPEITREEMESIERQEMEDTSLVRYLMSLTDTQLALAQRLGVSPN